MHEHDGQCFGDDCENKNRRNMSNPQQQTDHSTCRHTAAILCLSMAIAVAERYYEQDSDSRRRRNPGNLSWTQCVPGYEAVENERFVTFRWADDGFRSLRHYLVRIMDGQVYGVGRDSTLTDLGVFWASPVRDFDMWALVVANAMCVNVTCTLADLGEALEQVCGL
jgi:hypothetical protein